MFIHKDIARQHHKANAQGGHGRGGEGGRWAGRRGGGGGGGGETDVRGTRWTLRTRQDSVQAHAAKREKSFIKLSGCA